MQAGLQRLGRIARYVPDACELLFASAEQQVAERALAELLQGESLPIDKGHEARGPELRFPGPARQPLARAL